jgi:phospholipase/carboxylesterase
MTQKPELSLEYLYHPPAMPAAKGAFFLLHGYGSNEEDLFSFVSDLPSDYHYFSLRAPFALEPFGYAWYAINFDAPEGKWSNTEQAVESRGMILRFIDEACTAYRIDQSDINLLGFSQGCILSFALALSYPERFRRVVGLSGHINPKMLHQAYASKDHKHLKVYSSHGQLDPVIPVAWAQRTPPFLEDLGIELQFDEFPIGHGVSPQNFQALKEWLNRTA